MAPFVSTGWLVRDAVMFLAAPDDMKTYTTAINKKVREKPAVA